MADDDVDFFVYWFALRLSIDITPNAFMLHTKDASIVVPTYLYVRKVKEVVEIASVGADPEALNDAYRVDLFGGHEPPVNGPDKLEYLDAYFRYLFFQATTKRWLIRPIVVVRGVDRLANAVGGYQRSLIREALTRAGAASIRFE